jgi:hypothetical protein
MTLSSQLRTRSMKLFPVSEGLPFGRNIDLRDCVVRRTDLRSESRLRG